MTRLVAHRLWLTATAIAVVIAVGVTGYVLIRFVHDSMVRDRVAACIRAHQRSAGVQKREVISSRHRNVSIRSAGTGRSVVPLKSTRSDPCSQPRGVRCHSSHSSLSAMRAPRVPRQSAPDLFPAISGTSTRWFRIRSVGARPFPSAG